jgi:ATP-binding cassette subfamily C protein
VGLAWLGALGASVLVGGWATREIYPRFATLVEPWRDRLVALSVASAIRRSTTPGARPDKAAVARVTRQVEIVRDATASLLVLVQGFVVATVSALVGLSTLAPQALFLVLPPLAAGLFFFVSSIGALVVRQRLSLLADEHIAEATTTVVESRRDIVAAGGEGLVDEAMAVHIDEQARQTRALARLTARRSFAVSVGGLLPVVLVLLAAPWLVRHGMTAGTVLGVLTYVLSGIHPALQSLVRGLATNAVWLTTAVRRILEGAEESDLSDHLVTLDTWPPPPSPAATPVAASVAAAVPDGAELRFESVTFRYGAVADPVVRDLDLVVDPGEHLAVVGPSGVGKSTLALLAAGLLVPDTGRVMFGDALVSELGVAARRQTRVLIPQQAYVFAGSIEANLTYLTPGLPRAVLDEATVRLGARTLVERLGGWDGDVDPASLSAGERQLLTLVRAYVSSAPLVILDEATCHLDPESEARVELAFARRPGALVVIAHRMSSARRAKRILVMDGHSVTAGTHEELLSASLLYRDLVGAWDEGPAAGPDPGPGPTTSPPLLAR